MSAPGGGLLKSFYLLRYRKLTTIDLSSVIHSHVCHCSYRLRSHCPFDPPFDRYPSIAAGSMYCRCTGQTQESFDCIIRCDSKKSRQLSHVARTGSRKLFNPSFICAVAPINLPNFIIIYSPTYRDISKNCPQ
jgi:hypothetical protein